LGGGSGGQRGRLHAAAPPGNAAVLGHAAIRQLCPQPGPLAAWLAGGPAPPHPTLPPALEARPPPLLRPPRCAHPQPPPPPCRCGPSPFGWPTSCARRCAPWTTAARRTCATWCGRWPRCASRHPSPGRRRCRTGCSGRWARAAARPGGGNARWRPPPNVAKRPGPQRCRARRRARGHRPPRPCAPAQRPPTCLPAAAAGRQLQAAGDQRHDVGPGQAGHPAQRGAAGGALRGHGPQVGQVAGRGGGGGGG
jgi:hypothetical protein